MATDPLATLLVDAPDHTPTVIRSAAVEVDYARDEAWIDDHHEALDGPRFAPFETLLRAGFFAAGAPGGETRLQVQRTGRTVRYALAGSIAPDAVVGLLRLLVHAAHVPAQDHAEAAAALGADAVGPRMVWNETIAAIRLAVPEGSGREPVGDWGRYAAANGVLGYHDDVRLRAAPGAPSVPPALEDAFLATWLDGLFKPLERVDEPGGEEPELQADATGLVADGWSGEALGFAWFAAAVAGRGLGEVDVTVS